MANEEEKPDDRFYKEGVPGGDDGGVDDGGNALDDKDIKAMEAEEKEYSDEGDHRPLPDGNVRKHKSGVQAKKMNDGAASNNVLTAVDETPHTFTMLGGAAIVMVIVVLLGRKYLRASSRRQNKTN